MTWVLVARGGAEFQQHWPWALLAVPAALTSNPALHMVPAPSAATSRPGHSLFGRVIELILPRAVETLLDPRVAPEAHHGGQQLRREGLGVLHPTHHVAHHLGVGL